MTGIATERYIAVEAAHGWDVLDTEKDVVIGICSTEADAAKTVQCRNALADANTKRLAAAEFKREIENLGRREGAQRLALFLRADDDGTLDALPIQAALLAVPGLGVARAVPILRATGVTALNRRVRDLTRRQRGEIALALDRHR